MLGNALKITEDIVKKPRFGPNIRNKNRPILRNARTCATRCNIGVYIVFPNGYMIRSSNDSEEIWEGTRVWRRL